MKKILFYNMTMAAGGAERVISNLANELSKKNEIKIATMLNKGIAYKLNDNIEVLQPPQNDKKDKITLLKNAILVLKNIKKYSPDYIIAFGATSCFLICFFRFFNKQIKKSKLIISERNNPECEYTNKVLKKIANILYEKADIMVFQTVDAQNFFSEKIREKSVIIPNPINEKFIKKVDSNIKREESIVTVGRLESQKNHHGLIKACKIVFDKYPNYKLKIYGIGILREELIQLTIDLRDK